MEVTNPKITIIVPVYKTEQYLSKCIESILAQTFTDYELLLIDDGSPDNSGKICEKYAEKDYRIKVFHQENAGVSVARNKGIDEAEGNYICFIDSDDCIEPSYLYDFELIDDLPDGTILMQGYKDNYNGSIYRNERRSYDNDYFSSDIGSAIEYVQLFHSGYPVCKLYQRSILHNTHIRFIQDIHSYEDSLFNLEYFSYIKTIKVTSKAGYIYEHRNNNSLSQRYLPFKEREMILSLFYKKSTILLKQFSISEAYSKKVHLISVSLLFQAIHSLYRPQFNVCNKDRKQYLKYLLQNYGFFFSLAKESKSSNYFINSRSPLIIDLYYSFLFRLRYSFTNLYKYYLKYL